MNSYSSYGMSNSAFGFLAGMGVGLVIFSIALAVFSLIVMWKLFVKAGEPGWKCLIPIYNVYMMFKIAWEGKWFWFLFLAYPICLVCTLISAGFGGFMMMAAGIFSLVMTIMLSVKMASAFGKSGGFAVGLILLSLIFYAILAFGSAVYVGNGVNSAVNANTDNSTDKFEF